DAVVNIQQDGTGKNPVLTFLWKHCRSVIVGVRMERGIVAEVIADFSGNEMPPSWRRFVRRTSGSGEFLARVPARALLAVSGRFDSSLLTDLIRTDAKKNPQWEEARKYGRALFSGLDVFDVEPLPLDHPLRNLPNTVLTPHLGYVTVETYKIFYGDAVENIAAFLSGAPVRVINNPASPR
ncbi:MAG: hypothetical protein IIC24_12765, partial [Chloroflexi bacterium]|nr:hypothetical protein [Chloroflexota bacterium]